MASLLAFRRHDHRHCIDQALQEAEQLCARREVRLTPLRRRVLELVWQNHQPSGAYQLLDQLGEGSASRPAPATVYRALDFLQEQGLVHRLASLNAYIGCPHAERHHRGHFLICKHCQATVEITSSQVAEAIDASARAAGFEVEEEWVEVLGACAGCRRNRS